MSDYVFTTDDARALLDEIRERQLAAFESEFWHNLIDKSPGVTFKPFLDPDVCPQCGQRYCPRWENARRSD